MKGKFDSLVGDTLSLIIRNNADVRVFAGRIECCNGALFFVNPGQGWKVYPDQGNVARIKAVNDEMRDAFECQVCPGAFNFTHYVKPTFL